MSLLDNIVFTKILDFKKKNSVITARTICTLSTYFHISSPIISKSGSFIITWLYLFQVNLVHNSISRWVCVAQILILSEWRCLFYKKRREPKLFLKGDHYLIPSVGKKVLLHLILASWTKDESFIVELGRRIGELFKTFIWKLQDKCFNFSTWHNVNANALNSFCPRIPQLLGKDWEGVYDTISACECSWWIQWHLIK